MSSNVDAAELEKFGALAQRWWDASGEMRPLSDTFLNTGTLF